MPPRCQHYFFLTNRKRPLRGIITPLRQYKGRRRGALPAHQRRTWRRNQRTTRCKNDKHVDGVEEEEEEEDKEEEEEEEQEEANDSKGKDGHDKSMEQVLMNRGPLAGVTETPG